MEYTKLLHKGIVNSFQHAVDTKTHALMSYVNSPKQFQIQLDSVCKEFGCQFFGYNLIRLLHKEYGVPSSKGETYHLIMGRDFSVDSISRPSKIGDDEKDIYAQVLSEIVVNNKYAPITLELARSRFELILKYNQFLEDDQITTRDIKKKDILDIARMLNLSLPNTEELLFRSMEDGTLSSTSAEDMIEKFAIVAHLTKVERDSLLNDYLEATKNIRKVSYLKRKDNITEIIIRGFSDILNPKEKKAYERWRDDNQTYRKECLTYLLENAKYLKGHSNTARMIYEKLLLYIIASMSEVPDVKKQERYDEQAEFEMFTRIKEALLGWDDDTPYYPLSKEEQTEAVQTLLNSKGNDSLLETYFNWAVLSVDSKGNTFRKELGSRMEQILSGKEQVKKEDILFSLFLACASEWTHMATPSVEDLKNRLEFFINYGNIILSECFLEKFYLPHALESSITLAILRGSKAEDLLLTVVSGYPALQTNVKTNSLVARQKKIPLPSEKSENEVIPPFSSPREREIFKSLDGKIKRFLRRNKTVKNDELLVRETAMVARKIREVWEREQFHAIDIYFTDGKKFGYIPAVNIGREYVEIGCTPSNIHKILYEGRHIPTTFYETRVPSGQKDNKNYDRFVTIDKRYQAEMGELNNVHCQLLHRKAVIYLILIQLEIACGAESYRIEAEWNDSYKENREKSSEDALIEFIMNDISEEDVEESPENTMAEDDHGESYVVDLKIPVDVYIHGNRIMKIHGFDMATLTATEQKYRAKQK